MKNKLIVASVLMIGILLYCLLRPTARRERDPCAYLLENFDFHYKNETDSPTIVMVGNSLVRHGQWEKLLQRNDILNRGISGDKLQCIAKRVQYLKGTTAKICFIEGGINDVHNQDPDTLLRFYETIVDFCKQENIIPVINLVVYISPKAIENYPYLKDHKKINELVKNLNGKVAVFAAKNKIDIIDLNPFIAGQNQELGSEFTGDGIHLSEEAYRIWAEQISVILDRHHL